MSIGKIESVQAAGGSKLALTFDDAVHAVIDLAPIVGKHAALASPSGHPAIPAGRSAMNAHRGMDAMSDGSSELSKPEWGQLQEGADAGLL